MDLYASLILLSFFLKFILEFLLEVISTVVMDNKEIPTLKSKTLTSKLNVAVEDTLKADLELLKTNHRVDVPEWIRKLIRDHLPGLKKQVGLEDAS